MNMKLFKITNTPTRIMNDMMIIIGDLEISDNSAKIMHLLTNMEIITDYDSANEKLAQNPNLACYSTSTGEYILYDYRYY